MGQGAKATFAGLTTTATMTAKQLDCGSSLLTRPAMAVPNSDQLAQPSPSTGRQPLLHASPRCRRATRPLVHWRDGVADLGALRMVFKPARTKNRKDAA